MRRLLAALLALPAAAADPVPTVDTVVHIALPREIDERRPLEVPTEIENTVELDFPWPLADWAGRGFTPDPTRFAGEFIIEARRGSARIFVTPVSPGAHRVLFVVLAPPAAPTRSVPVEFLPAPAGLAWRKAVLANEAPAAASAPSFVLGSRPPIARYREPGADSELGLLRTLRLMLNSTAEGAAALVAANPALAMAAFDGDPRSFGDYTLANRYAVRDGTTDELGLCVGVSNLSTRRLLFDPKSWLIRVGDRVYPVQTVDFPAILEPGMSAAAFLVLGRGPNGEATRLEAGNVFSVSVRVSASVDAGSAAPTAAGAPSHR